MRAARKNARQSPESEVRYIPPECIGVRHHIVSGFPGGEHISTRHVERQNLTMRMQMRRFTRLTSKKVEKLEHALALH